jgi:hypothetical protein
MPGLAVGLSGIFLSIQIDAFKILQPTIVNDSIRFTYQVLVDVGQTVTPKFTFLDGAPRMRVLFGDKSSPKPVTNGVEVSHTYYVGGLYTITLLGASQELYLEQVDISGDHVVVPEIWRELFQFRALTRLNDIWVIGYGEVGILRIGR